jgi:DNA-binding NarL/FixJ family response regulator
VRDGDEAVLRFKQARDTAQPFDVVMMDLTVPGGKGGRDAMQEILKVDPAARGIVSSGYSSDPVMANFRAHGFRGMLAKPYRVADLSRTLREVLAGA